MTERACKTCKHFRVPDDGQEWGCSGICNELQYAQQPVLLFDIAGGLAEDYHTLSCGTVVVREWYVCDLWEDPHPRNGVYALDYACSAVRWRQLR